MCPTHRQEDSDTLSYVTEWGARTSGEGIHGVSSELNWLQGVMVDNGMSDLIHDHHNLFNTYCVWCQHSGRTMTWAHWVKVRNPCKILEIQVKGYLTCGKISC